MMDRIPNRLSRRLPTRFAQAKRMGQHPSQGLNAGGVRTGAAKRAASYGRKLQKDAPDATRR